MHKIFIYLTTCIIGFCLISCSTEKTGEKEKDGNKEFITIEFEADNSIFPNPERGLYTYREYGRNSNPITAKDLNRIRQDNITLVFMTYNLKDFITKPLDENMLKLIQDNFDALRANGAKTVLRFAYSLTLSALVYDADQEIVLTHIAQLKPLFEKNKDVITVLEAGFIGVWGEWYYSTYYGNEDYPDYDKRRVILNALLEAMPKERMISLRYPVLKTEMLKIGLNEPLTESEAYNQTYKARISHHNDCFLADASDMGTFTVRGDREYTASDSRYTCVGGETCTRPTSYSECTKAIEAMSTYHWSYLNIDYHEGMLNDWKQKGCFDEIQRHLGYRLLLTQTKYPKEARAGNNYELTLTIENKGFAAPYNPRKAEIHFRSATTGEIAYIHKMDADPRFWFSGIHQVEEEIKLPANMKPGTYEVLLFLPDPTELLYNRPEYAIRLANKDTWEASTGYNRLFNQDVK